MGASERHPSRLNLDLRPDGPLLCMRDIVDDKGQLVGRFFPGMRGGTRIWTAGGKFLGRFLSPTRAVERLIEVQARRPISKKLR
jgi:hypothetical protein